MVAVNVAFSPAPGVVAGPVTVTAPPEVETLEVAVPITAEPSLTVSVTA